MTLSLRIVALLRNTFDTLFYFAAMAVKATKSAAVLRGIKVAPVADAG